MTAVSTLLLGYPLAYALVRAKIAFLKSAMLIIVVTPLFLGEVVRTYSWIIVLGNNGFINSVLLKLGMIDAPTPTDVHSLRRRHRPGACDAAGDGDHARRRALLISTATTRGRRTASAPARSAPSLPSRCPCRRPASSPASPPAFAWTFSAFATPQLIGGGQVNMVSNLVYQLGFASFNFPFAASLSVAGLVLPSVCSRCCGRAQRGASSSRAALMRNPRPSTLGGRRRRPWWCGTILAFVLLPALVVVMIAAFNDARDPVFPARAGPGAGSQRHSPTTISARGSATASS